MAPSTRSRSGSAAERGPWDHDEEAETSGDSGARRSTARRDRLRGGQRAWTGRRARPRRQERRRAVRRRARGAGLRRAVRHHDRDRARRHRGDLGGGRRVPGGSRPEAGGEQRDRRRGHRGGRIAGDRGRAADDAGGRHRHVQAHTHPSARAGPLGHHRRRILPRRAAALPAALRAAEAGCTPGVPLPRGGLPDGARHEELLRLPDHHHAGVLGRVRCERRRRRRLRRRRQRQHGALGRRDGRELRHDRRRHANRLVG